MEDLGLRTDGRDPNDEAPLAAGPSILDPESSIPDLRSPILNYNASMNPDPQTGENSKGTAAVTASLHDWFGTPLGAFLLEREQAYLDQATPDIFGYHALQFGLPQLDLLRESRITHRAKIAPSGPADLLANFADLPIDTQSVDLAVLPHVLEFSAQPHDILREIDRIMIPEGRIIIVGFNPWSLFGMRRSLGSTRNYPWNGRFVSLIRIKDWLSLLGFDVSAGSLACYVPPFQAEKWIRRFRFMEPAGDRWWGVGGGVYMLQAIKRVRGMRVITPRWADRAAEKKFAAAGGSSRNSQGSMRDGSHLRVVK